VYTINHIHEEILPKAHQTSAKYPEQVSEFDAVGLTPQFVEGVKAPFVQESRVKYAVALREIIPISWNDTFFVIGEIQSVWVDTSLVKDDGFLELEKAGTLCSLGLDGYYVTKQRARLAYAKPDQPVQQID
jgi:flavin reductase (DIM6/NTAB) family NADH-FMN oxidoreductase RutF